MSTPTPLECTWPGGISRRRVVLGSTAAGLTLPLLGCGGGTEILFAPFFVFAFQGVADRKILNVSFSPDSASQGQTRGSFDAQNSFINVRDPVNAGQSFGTNFRGSFDGRDLQITVEAPQPPLSAAYVGRFTDNDTVVLSPTSGAGETIAVRRNENDSFLPMLTGDWTGTDADGVAWQMRLDTEPANSDFEATVLLVGTELRGPSAAAPLLGYASVRYIELSIARASGNRILTGTLVPSSVAVPAGTPQVTETIAFSGGGTLRRV